jgi:hypothetical protein
LKAKWCKPCKRKSKNFYIRADGKQDTYCKAHCRARRNAWVKKNKKKYAKQRKEWIKKNRLKRTLFTSKLKSIPCFVCKKRFPPCAMQFDHVRGKKLTEISKLRHRGYKTLKAEIEKCEVLCANCHSIKSCIDRFSAKKFKKDPRQHKFHALNGTRGY